MSRTLVLIVEDNRDLRLALDVQIRHLGYGTAFAADAEGAIDAATEEQPALILLDLGLDEGDGFEVLRRLRGAPRFEGLPVVVLSSRAREPNEADSLRAGADGFFEKPITAEQLRQVLQRFLPSAAGIH